MIAVTRTVLLAFLLFMLFVLQAAASSAAVADPAGDFPEPDILMLEGAVENDMLYVRLAYAAPFDGEMGGAVFIDADANPLTGYREGTGAEYVYAFSVMPIVYAEPFVSATLNDEMVAEDTLTVAGNQVTIALPLPGDSDPEIFAAAYTGSVRALQFDRAPDYGTLNLADGNVTVPATDAPLGAAIGDPAGDAPQGDATGLAAEVHDGVLDLLVTYAAPPDSGEAYQGEDRKGWILLDTDQNLATGFMNTGQVPPSFGVDYRIDYTTGSMLGTDAALERIDPASALVQEGFIETAAVPLGVPYNDAALSIAGDRVFLRIPLHLLGQDDGRMYIAADSFSLDGLLAGGMDQVPDAGMGAVDTGTGGLAPPLSYAGTPPVTVPDPAGDSAGFGYDGDDITAVTAGYAGETLVLNITYTDLAPDDGAVTTVFLDTDRDGATAEYALVASRYQGNPDAVLFGDFSGGYGVRGVRHLLTMQGDSIYLSLPPGVLQNPGSLDLFVETALVPSAASIPLTDMSREWISSGDVVMTGTGQVHITFDKTGRTVYDRSPDTGAITVARG